MNASEKENCPKNQLTTHKHTTQLVNNHLQTIKSHETQYPCAKTFYFQQLYFSIITSIIQSIQQKQTANF